MTVNHVTQDPQVVPAYAYRQMRNRNSNLFFLNVKFLIKIFILLGGCLVEKSPPLRRIENSESYILTFVKLKAKPFFFCLKKRTKF